MREEIWSTLNVLRDFAQTRNIRRAFLDNGFYKRKCLVYEYGCCSESRCYCLSMCYDHKAVGSLLPNGALFKWVLIVINNERCNLTSSQRALSNHPLTAKTFSSSVRF